MGFCRRSSGSVGEDFHSGGFGGDFHNVGGFVGFLHYWWDFLMQIFSICNFHNLDFQVTKGELEDDFRVYGVSRR